MLGLFNLGKKASLNIPPVVLLILDGWGIAPASPGNPITTAKTPVMTWLTTNFPNGELLAAGESVGLPANEVGNTEVGHINMGAGRVILQDLKRISKTIEEGSFPDNRAIRSAIDHAKKNNSNLHIMGLYGSGRVHSSMEHFWAIMDTCKKLEFSKVVLHIFTDGRDTEPKEAESEIAKLTEKLKSYGFGQVATIAGRYWAMDRDRRWDRTEKTYNAMVLGQGPKAATPEEAVKNSYAKGQTDEFIEPTVIGNPITVSDNDAVIFFNFRIDRPRQLTLSFILPDFENSSFIFGNAKDREAEKVKLGATFKRTKVPKNLFFVTMTEYQKDLPVSAIAFPPEQVQTPLAEVISQAGLTQLHLSESEKRRFITYYFNGLREEKFNKEEDVIVSSPKVATYDKKPEMAVGDIVKEFKNHAGNYNFIVINIANPDMVAHTGNLQATLKAIEFVDTAVGEIAKETLKLNGTLLITADHGNAEELLTYEKTSYYVTTSQGTVNTDHSNNPVPIIIAHNNFQGKPKQIARGILGDVAPTILYLLKLQVPSVMTGRNLLG